MKDKQWFLLVILIFIIFGGHTVMLHSKMAKEREAIKADKEAYIKSATEMRDRLIELEGDLSSKKYFEKYGK